MSEIDRAAHVRAVGGGDKAPGRSTHPPDEDAALASPHLPPRREIVARRRRPHAPPARLTHLFTRDLQEFVIPNPLASSRVGEESLWGFEAERRDSSAQKTVLGMTKYGGRLLLE